MCLQPMACALLTAALAQAGWSQRFVGIRCATVQFSGLAQSFVGVWHVAIPSDAPAGPSVCLVVLDGLLSNALSSAVQWRGGGLAGRSKAA